MPFYRKWRPKRQRVVVEGGRAIDCRSALEADLAKQIDKLAGRVRFEEEKFSYDVPARTAKYLPDFILANDIIVEGKGEFETADRMKHLLLKVQRPELDIRFVFSNPNRPIYKGSPTSYAKWCDDNGFKYAKGLIPAAWFKEKRRAS